MLSDRLLVQRRKIEDVTCAAAAPVSRTLLSVERGVPFAPCDSIFVGSIVYVVPKLMEKLAIWNNGVCSERRFPSLPNTGDSWRAIALTRGYRREQLSAYNSKSESDLREWGSEHL